MGDEDPGERLARVEEALRQLERSVREVKSTLTWAGRLVLGSVLLAVIGLVVSSPAVAG